MAIPGFDHIYSENDWRILERAHRRACTLLNCDPKQHPLATRIACTVMVFFDRGERDFGRLAAMAAKQDFNLMNKRGKPEEHAACCPLPGYRPWESDAPRQVSALAPYEKQPYRMRLMVPRLTTWQWWAGM